MNIATGYGPSVGKHKLYFSGNQEDFKIWETRFINYIYTLDKAVCTALLPQEPGKADPTEHPTYNRRKYAVLVQVLDERSLLLIMNDYSHDGRGALKALRAHYDSQEKPRVLTLYEELTTLTMASNESITDYIIRAERAATGLKNANENISDNLIIAMLLKGLPEFYRPFIVVHTQLDKYKTLMDFKSALTNYANTEALRSPQHESCALKSSNFSQQNIQCLACGKPNHRSNNCPNKGKLRCSFCSKAGHVETVCFLKKRKEQNENAYSATSNALPHQEFTFKTNVHDNLIESTKVQKQMLLVDCGATSHIVNDETIFTSFDKSFHPDQHYVELADGHRSNKLATHRGEARIMLLDKNGVYSYINLKNALLVPSFPTSLFSVRAAADAGAKVVFTQNMSALSIGNTNFDIRHQGNLYFLPTYQHEQIFTSANTTKTLQEWHRVLGHMNREDIERLEKVTNGMNIIKSGSCEKICDVCIENKITKQPKSKDIPNIKATHPLERVHSDVCGPINPSSREGFKYIINFVDEYSGMLFVYILRSKDEATTALKNFLSDTSPYGKVKGIHTDNGGEYISEDFQSVLRNNNIHHSTTSPHSSYQNGKAERSWRSLMEMARCLSAEASISKQFWPYAVRHAQYLRNRSFQRLSQKTAFELFTGSKPDLRKLHIFGSKCTFYVEGPKQKLDSRGQSGLYLGVQARSNSSK